MRKRTSYDTPKAVLIPEGKKFALVFFGPPSRIRSMATVNSLVLILYVPGGMMVICGPRSPSFSRNRRAL